MQKAIEIQAPNELINKIGFTTVFLGGSIEMGKAEDWQKRLINSLSDKPFIFLNPRRDDWDSSWVQSIENEQFNKQVTWELTGLEMADLIVMYFDPNTMSPISLLELGLHAKANKMIVICPDGFWRKGNVDIVCKMYGVKQVANIEELIVTLQEIVK